MIRHAIRSGLAAVAVLLPIVAANAADPPEVAQRKQEMTRAYQTSHTHGICELFAALRRWQASDWPDGQAAVTQFLNDKVLPRFVQDPATLKDQTAEQVEAEFGRFCGQAAGAVAQLVEKLVQVQGAEAQQAGELRDTFLAATFLGQCQAASALYLQGVPEHKDRLEKFVVAEIYSKDAKYRREAINYQAIEDGNLGELDKVTANSDKELQYWKDCDTAEAKFMEIFEQLKVVP